MFRPGSTALLALVAALHFPGPAAAQSLLANGAPAAGQNQFYAVSTATGAAVSASSVSSGIVAGLATRPTGQVVGLLSNNLVTVNVPANTTSVVGPLGVSASGFDVLPDGRAFTVPTTASAVQLHAVNLTTGAATPVGAANAIRDAVVAAGGPSTSPFVIGLGSVGGTVYGVDTNSSSLIALNPDTGAAAVVGGQAGSVTAGTLADGTARSRFSGFAALTGADTDGDGATDALFGGVNFFDDDNNTGTPTVRFGGLARFSTATGSWELVGSNPGLIYFGMAPAPVPEPAGALALAAAVLTAWRARNQARWTGPWSSQCPACGWCRWPATR